MKELVDNRAIDYQTVHTITISPLKIFFAIAVILILILILIWSRIDFIAESYKLSGPGT